MADPESTHHAECWRNHPACAVARVEALEAENRLLGAAQCEAREEGDPIRSSVQFDADMTEAQPLQRLRTLVRTRGRVGPTTNATASCSLDMRIPDHPIKVAFHQEVACVGRAGKIGSLLINTIHRCDELSAFFRQLRQGDKLQLNITDNSGVWTFRGTVSRTEEQWFNGGELELELEVALEDATHQQGFFSIDRVTEARDVDRLDEEPAP